MISQLKVTQNQNVDVFYSLNTENELHTAYYIFSSVLFI